jgi:hypothetical protein
MPGLSAFRIRPQPDDTTCGPTCLHAIYHFHGDGISLEEVIRGVRTLTAAGTLAVLLAIHALERGYQATIYTYNLHVFDPTWFSGEGVDLAAKLRAQAEVKEDPRLPLVTEAYLQFLELGGRLRFRELTPDLIRHQLQKGRPILTGLSATYLYQSPREIGEHRVRYDDLRGRPAGHFVVLFGYDPETRQVQVADPLVENPAFAPHIYHVSIQRVLGAVLLGVLTHDANLLVLTPPDQPVAVGAPTEPSDPADPTDPISSPDRPTPPVPGPRP